MRECGILMTGESMRAYFAGLKGQTRRVVKGGCGLYPYQPIERAFTGKYRTSLGYPASERYFWAGFGNPEDPIYIKSPYGGPGDRLWLRETFDLDADAFTADGPFLRVTYRADGATHVFRPTELSEKTRTMKLGRHPSIHMPRDLCRAAPLILNVRVERLHDITEEDALVEGIVINVDADTMHPLIRLTGPYPECNYIPLGATPKQVIVGHYASLWDRLNAKRGYAWEKNLWVWVYEFEKYGMKT